MVMKNGDEKASLFIQSFRVPVVFPVAGGSGWWMASFPGTGQARLHCPQVLCSRLVPVANKEGENDGRNMVITCD